MVRKKKIKPETWLKNMFQGLIDKANARDMIYVIAYIASVDLVYRVVSVAKTSIFPYFSPFPFSLIPSPPKEAPLIDMKTLSIALVGGYMLLKIDVDDVASAVGSLKDASIKALTSIV